MVVSCYSDHYKVELKAIHKPMVKIKEDSLSRV